MATYSTRDRAKLFKSGKVTAADLDPALSIGGGSASVDSATLLAIIDSDYINQRATLDSTALAAIIDSDYIKQRATVINTIKTVDTFIGDDSTVTFTLSKTPININAVTVNYQGVLQLQDAYSIIGNEITFDSAPAAGTTLNIYIENYAFANAAGNLNYTTLTYTGDDSSVDFDVTQISVADNILVMENGVVQTPTIDYTVSNGIITFDSAPATGVSIQIRQFPTTAVLAQGGPAAAWVNFNGTGTVAIRASYNVSSITDNGTGDYTINFTNNMNSADYGTFSTCGRGAAGGAGIIGPGSADPTISDVRITTTNYANAATDREFTFVGIYE